MTDNELLQAILVAVTDSNELAAYQLGATVAVGLLLSWICTWPLRGKI